MATALRFTTAHLDTIPEDGRRYEIIDGELIVSPQPDLRHQLVSTGSWEALSEWDRQSGAGLAISFPGVIFAEDQAVALDVVWVSRERLALLLGEDGKLHGAPDLTVEVLSPGLRNEQRDRETKLTLYSRRGVREYLIVDWQRRQMDVYRREELALRHMATLYPPDVVRSPLLPCFAVPLGQFFQDLPVVTPGP